MAKSDVQNVWQKVMSKSDIQEWRPKGKFKVATKSDFKKWRPEVMSKRDVQKGSDLHKKVLN